MVAVPQHGVQCIVAKQTPAEENKIVQHPQLAPKENGRESRLYNHVQQFMHDP